MGAVLWVFLIALLNLGLGYALAVWLGFGPANLWEAWEALAAERPEVEAPPPLDEHPEIMALKEELEAPPPIDAIIDQGLDVELRSEAYEEDLPDIAPDAPENWDLNEKYVETSILKLNIAMMKSGARVTEIDTRLRACQGKTDVETVRRCLKELQEDCKVYLVEQSEAATHFHNRLGELGELAVLGDDIEMANLEQAAQIETTLSNLQHMDFESDLEAANQRLLDEIKLLRAARHRMRDSQEAAFLTVASYENRLDKIEKRLFNDPLTKLRNRVGLETTLWQWWQDGRVGNRQMSAALLDLDGFGPINDQYGSLIGDRLLFQVARLIEAKIAKSDLPGRFAGQRFMIVMSDVGPRVAIRNLELLRQSLERLTFHSGAQEIRLTASAGITEIVSGDSRDAVYKRLEEMLKMAKEAGRNRSFFYVASEPEEVQSPNLGAEYKDIRI